MSVGLGFGGGPEMERALARLKVGTGKGAVRRALKKALEPIRAQAAAAGPFEVAITSKLNRSQAAGARGEGRGREVVQYVGAVDAGGKGAPHAHLVEFGTGPRHHASGKYVGFVAPRPFLRPAWDANAPDLVQRVSELVWIEITKALERQAARDAAGGA